MGRVEQSLLVILILLLLNLKLQQTNFLIPKMLQIFILHIIIIILDTLIIENLLLQLLLILLVHNFVVSLVSTIAEIINIVTKHFAVVVPQDNDSMFQVINTASNAEHNAAVPNKTFTPNIVVIV